MFDVNHLSIDHSEPALVVYDSYKNIWGRYDVYDEFHVGKAITKPPTWIDSLYHP